MGIEFPSSSFWESLLLRVSIQGGKVPLDGCGRVRDINVEKEENRCVIGKEHLL